LKIPPNDPNYEVESVFVFPQNSLLLSVSPHMHLRGKDFRYDVIYPDGKQETILSVPRYDFGWQTTYELAEPKLLPRGARMHCVAHFDNSAENLANPDPSKEVGWGEQTWEEMMFGWFEVALADQDLTQPAIASSLRVKEFLAKGDTARLDDRLRSEARAALTNEKSFDQFCGQLFDLIPQLDRVCITGVENGKLRLKLLQERPGFKSSFRSRSTVVSAAGQSLAEYVLGEKVVVNQVMTDTAGSVMAKMSKKDIRSSMHVPVLIDGVPCTINFWSAEAGAFPPEAASLLEEIAHLMTDGAKITQK
jgi:hypothetical protein